MALKPLVVQVKSVVPAPLSKTTFAAVLGFKRKVSDNVKFESKYLSLRGS